MTAEGSFLWGIRRNPVAIPKAMRHCRKWIAAQRLAARSAQRVAAMDRAKQALGGR